MQKSLKAKKSDYCRQVCRAWCCRNLVMASTSDDPDIEQFFRLRNIQYDPVTKQIAIPCKCKWIDNRNKCHLYSWRPNSCRVYECEKLKAMTIDS
jgi:Fe-S-cluster containining protein